MTASLLYVILAIVAVVLFPVTGCPWWIHWLQARRTRAVLERRRKAFWKQWEL